MTLYIFLVWAFELFNIEYKSEIDYQYTYTNEPRLRLSKALKIDKRLGGTNTVYEDIGYKYKDRLKDHPQSPPPPPSPVTSSSTSSIKFLIYQTLAYRNTFVVEIFYLSH